MSVVNYAMEIGGKPPPTIQTSTWSDSRSVSWGMKVLSACRPVLVENPLLADSFEAGCPRNKPLRFAEMDREGEGKRLAAQDNVLV